MDTSIKLDYVLKLIVPGKWQQGILFKGVPQRESNVVLTLYSLGYLHLHE